MKRSYTDEQKAEAVQDYLNGETCLDIAVSLGASRMTVLKWIRAAGHEPRPAGARSPATRDRQAETWM